MVEVLEQHTPVMRQYLSFKVQFPHFIVLFQMGDFYEVFFEDAEKVSKSLDIALTARGKSKGVPIPMAGIPRHALDSYLHKLIDDKYTVVQCDQVGKPNKKGIMERQVTRILTPGTLIDESLLDGKTENRIAAFYQHKKTLGVAWMTLSSHRIFVFETSEDALVSEINRIRPAETLAEDNLARLIPDEFMVTRVPESYFDLKAARQLLLDHLKIKDFSGFDCEHFSAGLVAAGAILQYIRETQKISADFINQIKREYTENLLVINPETRRNLEISETLRGEKEPTLFSLLDCCKTAMGSRFLRHSLHNPTQDLSIVEERLDSVQWLSATGYDNITHRHTQFSPLLAATSDLERISARIGLERARPGDLTNLRQTLSQLPNIAKMLEGTPCALLQQFYNHLSEKLPIERLLWEAIVDKPPVYLRDGGVIRAGYSKELDRLRMTDADAESYLAAIAEKEQERTGIKNLRVDFNQKQGYFIEVTSSYLDKVPTDYRRKQTLKDRERFINEELDEYEKNRFNSEDEALRLEKELFEDLLRQLSVYVDTLQLMARDIAYLDMLCAFAKVSLERRYCRPGFTDIQKIDIQSGRHPIVECLTSDFISNDMIITPEHRLSLITGPNMGGKSTFMRQTALIVLMAYCGCYVPAMDAEIGPVDQIFTRVGASDDMASGKSTFMVEMTEAANILNNATEKSLVLIDEIGRGTSTFDGLSLAWAVAHYLVTKNCSMSLFATHYFELTSLPEENSQIINLHVSAKKHEDGIVFLYKVEKGAASQSYGLEVAALAGVPKDVLRIAKRKLAELEQLSHLNHQQADLFVQGIAQHSEAVQATVAADDRFETLAAEIDQIQPDNLTPKEALDVLYQLKQSASKLQP